jgi:hypothetical protein
MMPLLDPEKLTDKIIESVQQNRTTLKAPALVKITTLARGLLPQSWYDFVAANIFRVYTSMDTFKGHGNE